MLLVFILHILTHCDLVTPYDIGYCGQYWFRLWLICCSAPGHYLNQRRLIINWTSGNKLQSDVMQSVRKFIWKCRLQIDSHFDDRFQWILIKTQLYVPTTKLIWKCLQNVVHFASASICSATVQSAWVSANLFTCCAYFCTAICTLVSWVHFKNAYELVNLRALKFSTLYSNV